VDDPIRTFVETEYRQVVSTVALVCGSVPTAEDSVQEALARAWRSERRARERLGAGAASTPDAPAASGDAHAVREALAALPRRQREASVLRYYGGLDVREIAATLDIAEGTAKAMLFRARQSLAIALGDDDPDPAPSTREEDRAGA
jgi:DNA-directed RNA polymerase specialized sigma24 family protein